MPSASIFLMKAGRSFTSKPMWSSTRPRVGACAVSTLANLSWPPGTSTTGDCCSSRPCRRRPSRTRPRLWGSPLPHEMDVLIPDRHGLGLVFEDFDAHAVRRHHEGLVKPAVVARQHRHAVGLPLRRLLLNVVDDEADMVDHRSDYAALSRFLPQVQIDPDAREPDTRRCRRDRRAAHRDEDLLVGATSFEMRCQWPMVTPASLNGANCARPSRRRA